MADNVEEIRKGYEAFINGDIDGVAAVMDENIRWEGPSSTDLPGGGTHEGRDAVLQMLGELREPFDQFDVTPDDFLDSGDRVVVLFHTEARTKDGNSVNVPGVHVWDMHDGKATRCQALTDTLEFARALGLS